MLDGGTLVTVFILRRLQEEYHVRGKRLYICFMNLEKAFDGVPRKVLEWTMRKNRLPDVLVGSVISLYGQRRQESDWILSCQRSLRFFSLDAPSICAVTFYSLGRCCH